MLNWRPVREIEQRTREIEIEIAQLRAENAKWRVLNASIEHNRNQRCADNAELLNALPSLSIERASILEALAESRTER